MDNSKGHDHHHQEDQQYQNQTVIKVHQHHLETLPKSHQTIIERRLHGKDFH